jgi:acetoin utilization deacetylase AcuC-like enzyme
VTEEQLLRGHAREHLDRLGVEQDFDMDTVWMPGIRDHAIRGVGGAFRAMELALAGEVAFSLMRPPGHHATRDRAMGFCYLGSIGLATLEARSRGVARVAVLDFDVHHGNGTEALLLGQEGTRFVSVHQHPCYPGTGTGDVGPNVINHCVAPGQPASVWREALSRGLEDVMTFEPDLIGFSAGFDAYVHDPLAHGGMDKADYLWLGEQIRALGRPAFHILEEGYSVDLPELVLHYLLGLTGRTGHLATGPGRARTSNPTQ